MPAPPLSVTPGTPAPTAAQALHLTHGNLYAALGVVCVLAWFVIHRFAAHRHPVAEWTAKLCLLAGGVVLAVCVGVVAKWVANVNNATANWLSSWFGDPTFSAKHWGVLTVLAVIDVVFVATTTYDLVRHVTGKKGATGRAATGRSDAGRGAAGRSVHAHWGTLEITANKYGWIGLGPLAATLPAPFGLWVVTWLTLLSEAVAHTLGRLFGMG